MAAKGSRILKPMISSKIPSLDDLLAELPRLRRAGKRIVFTNGCFDLLHVGHIRYLAAAGAQGDVLIVGLNSDLSVRAVKGTKRPIIGQWQRAEILAHIDSVDYIILFDEPDPHRLIAAIAPDVLVKGADWPADRIVGADLVKASGGKLVRVPLVPGVSTSAIIAEIARRYR